ncbi:hypothetical protein BBO_07516 [Beauveria brongniartii RCEF 3172]|uniref:Uncharacterized protein n=1 Tax=Beauveria brongniartii RCEF 3172 TaxID=1081107 RepID=A0A166ZDF4_9HYPO|nr:hypothetical protein BBO_07516 [Beauveria brongniartii RCEF 3172]
MSHDAPKLVVLSIEHRELHDKAFKWSQDYSPVTNGVKVQVEQCDYDEAPQQIDTGVSKLICTVSKHSDKVWLIFNEDKPNQKTEEGRKPASLPQSATATYEIIGGQPGNGDFILDKSTGYIAKKTYDDEVAKEAGIARIFEAAKSSNSVIIHAPPNLTDLALELVKILAQGMSPDLVLRPEEFCLVEEPLSHITLKTTLEHECIMEVSKFEKCVCAEGSRTCGIPTENESKAKIIEDGVQGKQIEAVFSRFKTPETHGAQPYNESGLSAGFLRAQNALQKVCPAQLYGRAAQCKSMSVGIENFISFRDCKPPIDLAVVVVRSRNMCVCKLTKGVKLQAAYLRRARAFGFIDPNRQKGKVTAGAVIAAHTGYSGANWHLDIAGVDRFDLHKETLAEAMDLFKSREALSKEIEDVTYRSPDIWSETDQSIIVNVLQRVIL